MSIYKTERPTAKRWATARLFSADLYDQRAPICGTHLVWAVVGHKHVRIMKPVTEQRFKMSRTQWDSTQAREISSCT